MTHPLPLSWPTLVVFWPVFVWAFIPELAVVARGPARGLIPAEDRGSLQVVLVGFSLAVAAALLLPLLVPRAALPGDPTVWFCAGLLTLVSGSLLRRHCFRVLGESFTGAVTVREDQRVVDEGAYRWVRHPSYTAAFLLVIGIALAMGSWLGLTVSLVVVVPCYVYRARVEEAALQASLGESYARFAATRRRFIPFVY